MKQLHYKGFKVSSSVFILEMETLNMVMTCTMNLEFDIKQDIFLKHRDYSFHTIDTTAWLMSMPHLLMKAPKGSPISFPERPR